MPHIGPYGVFLICSGILFLLEVSMGEEKQTSKANWGQNELQNDKQKSTLLPQQWESMFHQTETGS